MTDDVLGGALDAARDGDEAAFAVLWSALHPAVLRYLRVVVGDLAEDVASETWLQVARDLRRFSGGAGDFRAWLFRIARHRGIDHLRRAGRRRENVVESVEAHGHEPDAASQTEERFSTDWALRIIAGLPREQAEAVMLRVVIGLDVATTAEILGKRPGAVRIAAMRGLRRLANHPDVLARNVAKATYVPEEV
jgi:RNA polymerase sigma-70 factor (ECF subfamily)